MRRQMDYKKIFKEAQKNPEFWKEKISNRFLEDLLEQMEKQGINRSQLAKKINKKPAYITKIFRGNINFTLSTMVSLVMAVDSQLRIEVIKNQAAAIKEKEEFLSNILQFKQKALNIDKTKFNDLQNYEENSAYEKLSAA